MAKLVKGKIWDVKVLYENKEGKESYYRHHNGKIYVLADSLDLALAKVRQSLASNYTNIEITSAMMVWDAVLIEGEYE
jgi:hypothetical protein